MLLALSLVAHGGGAIAVAQAPTAGVAELRAGGERLRREQRLPEALAAYRAVIALEPAGFEDRFWIAKLESWTGALESAERDFMALLAERPDDYDSRIALADVRRWRGDTAGSRVALDDLRRRRPEDPEVLQRLAQLEPAPASARWEADLQYLGERLSGGAAGDGATLSLRQLPTQPVRWRAAVTLQEKFDHTEARGGGEIGWRLARKLEVSGSAFLAPGAEVLPRQSYAVAVTRPVVRGIVLAVDYGFDRYHDAGVHGVGSSLELYAGRWLFTARYRYTATGFDGAATSAGDHAAGASVGYGYGNAGLVRLFAAAGGEAFSQPSRDRIGRFDAHTVGVSWRHFVTPALGLEAMYARQERSDGGRQDSYGMRVVRRW